MLVEMKMSKSKELYFNCTCWMNFKYQVEYACAINSTLNEK